MKKLLYFASIMALLIICPCFISTGQAVSLKKQASPFPPPFTLAGFGINIHGNSYNSHELNLIKAAGFKVIRTDFLWHNIEREKGVFDFHVYDQLLKELAARNLQAILILDYGNPHYTSHKSITTPKERAAFKKFVTTAVTRYQKYDIIWEIWNEPDCIYFWEPQPGVDDYMTLVKEISPAIKKADPQAIVIAPAVGELFAPYAFLEACFQKGLLDLVDAVSVHPYRPFPPESVIEDYGNLRKLIQKYAPHKGEIPIISGEWGMSSSAEGRTTTKQAKYIIRMFLTNLSQGIPISIWYNWQNDGPLFFLKDHNWGMVTHKRLKPKKSHQAFRKLVTELAGATFVKRIDYPADHSVFILLFNQNNSQQKLIVAWTTKPQKKVKLANGDEVILTDMPQFYRVDQLPEF